MSRAHPWLREEDGALVLTLHAQPGASRTEVAGTHGEALKVRLAAPAIEGRANAALVRFLADSFAVPQRQVTVVQGAAARRKVVRVVSPGRRPEWAK